MGNGLGNFALDGENVRQITIVGLGPEMSVVAGVNELRVYPDLIGDSLNAPFQNMGDTEQLPDLTQVARRRVLEFHDTGAADDLEIGYLRQIGQNFVLHSIGEKRVLFVVA